MDKNKNYYKILSVGFTSTNKEIQKSYYKLSFIHHPDKSGDPEVFKDITDAYKTLCDPDLRKEYDSKSKFGAKYSEYSEFFDIDIDFSYEKEKSHLENFKKNEVNNIQIEIDPNDFDGSIEYERWVMCRSCDGTGKDLSSFIEIKDDKGNVIKRFEPDDGCDFCEGSGEDYNGDKCSFCMGKGKVGLVPCTTCKGDKRIMGKQRLKNIKLNGSETKIDFMGNFSKNGKVGYLLLTTI